MDTEWCLSCDRHLEGTQDLYCSSACRLAALPLHVSLPLPSSPQSPSLATPTQHSQWPGSGVEGIRAWASAVTPGAPSSSRRSHSSSSDDRTPSPSARSHLSTARPRPKLMQLTGRPLVPSTSLSYSSSDLMMNPSRSPSPVPSPPQPISTRTPHLSTHPLDSNPSSASGTTAPTTDSLATPVTPANAIPIARPSPSQQNSNTHKPSLWKQVRSLVGTPPTPTSRLQPLVHGRDSPFTLFARSGKHPLALLDEDLLGLPSSPKGAKWTVDLDDDDESEDERSDGLAGWFASQALEQRKAKEATEREAMRAKASGSVRRAAGADHPAFLRRGRKLERTITPAVYASVR